MFPYVLAPQATNLFSSAASKVRQDARDAAAAVSEKTNRVALGSTKVIEES